VPVDLMPKISILMSVYNKGEFLRESIQSILDQSYPDFEFIIRDNQSSDNSVDVVKSFADQRIKFERNSRNLGPVGSLNNCIEAAQGDYVTFAHGDDIWEKDFLAANIEHLEKNDSINISHSLMHFIDEQGAIRRTMPDKSIGDYRIESYDQVVKRLFKGCYVKTPTAFVRRKAMRYYDVRYVYTCDWDMFFQIAATGNDFLFINRPLMSYRVSTSSETAVGMRGGDMILESYLTLRNFFNNHQEYGRYRSVAFKRLSASVLRRSRDVASRETMYFFLCCAILCYPLTALSPVFHLYLVMGLLFGPRGLQALKRSSRSITRMVRSK
jgi:glycosyltransferase involved in cell wall biosynthesis